RRSDRGRSNVTTPRDNGLRILVSNDDGVLAPGIALLADVCATVGQVTVVAPDREQSGTSHSLTLHRPLRAHRRSDGAFQVDGTPTDCVLLALSTLMPDGPNWVISGVNHGPNMGEDVLYSGTVAAATPMAAPARAGSSSSASRAFATSPCCAPLRRRRAICSFPKRCAIARTRTPPFPSG